MRIIIAGGRYFNYYNHMVKACHKIFKQLSDEGFLSGESSIDISDMEIISGTARGADILGEKFASEHGIKIKRFPANWDLYGKSAGYRRNADMATYAKEDEDLGVLIAFWDGKSKGTKHMIDLANKHGLRVFVEEY